MTDKKPNTKLKKSLGLLDVYAISTGATLSGGFFLLPGIAAAEVGSAVVLAYLLAVVPLVPAMLSMVELATAMPKAGGLYFFLDRTLGPVVGTIGGIGTWLALIMKVAFVLVGIGAYGSLFFENMPVYPVAHGIAILLGVLSIFGAKKSGGLQLVLVAILLIILAIFIAGGVPQMDPARFGDLFDADFAGLMSTAGLVYLSYVGVTKIASLAEEVRDPERTLPRGIILAMVTAIVVYALGTAVMVGLVPMERLSGDLTPVATAAEAAFGHIGAILLSIAALLAFISVANAGLLSASRYPLAMSRDHLLPRVFRRLTRFNTPHWSIAVTVGTIILILLTLDPTGIAKLASAFQLLILALICVAVIVMRESKLGSYDPGYRSPLYPWMQIVGIVTPFILIAEMGMLPIAFSLGLVVIGVLWYAYYARGKVGRTGAIFHVFERLGRSRYEPLDAELRGILKEKGLRQEDPFEEVVARSRVYDIDEPVEFSEVVDRVAGWLGEMTSQKPEGIAARFMEGTRIGATPVTHGVALPHLRCEGISESEIVLVRSKGGVHIVFMDPLSDHDYEEEQTVHAVFFLVSPEDRPGQHLRMLAQIASRVDEDSFGDAWKAARSDHELREVLLHEERLLTFSIDRHGAYGDLVGKRIRDVDWPESCIVALILRDEVTVPPHGDTELHHGDRLTIIGTPDDIRTLRERFAH